MSLLPFLLLSLLPFSLCDVKFTATVQLEDSFISGPPLTRISPVSTMWYEFIDSGVRKIDNFERIRYDIPLPGGLLTEFYRYEGFQIRWTLCQDACTWQDVYDEHFPDFTDPTGGGGGTPSTINTTFESNVAVDEYIVGTGADSTQDVLSISTTTGDPVKLSWQDPEPVFRQRIVYISPGTYDDSGSFDSTTTFEPADVFSSINGENPICPEVDPRCYRLDLMFVYDASGSVSGDWGLQVDFIYNIASNLRVEPGWTNAGYQIFRTIAFKNFPCNPDEDCSFCCNSAYPEYLTLQRSALDLRTELWDLYDQGNLAMTQPYNLRFRFTAIIDGARRALNEMTDFGRHFSNPATLVLTDGNGNRPCPSPETRDGSNLPTFTVEQMQNEYNSSVLSIGTRRSQAAFPQFRSIFYDMYGTFFRTWNTDNPNNDDMDDDANDDDNVHYSSASSWCESNHDTMVGELYEYYRQQQEALAIEWFPPTIYAIGVGNVNPSTLEAIVDVQPGITPTDERFFTVASFSALDTILESIISLFLCELPGRASCPKDCLPGGFCCAGGCVCAVDCNALLGTSCQEGLCVVTQTNGTFCELGEPNDGTCFDNDACTSDICIDCRLTTPQDEPLCTPGASGCTNPDISEGSECDDGNDCTLNTTCVNRQCVGINVTEPTPANPPPENYTSICTDNSLCTVDYCSNGQCLSETIIGKECRDDDDVKDCLVPFCDPSTGECSFREVEVGEECRDNIDDDDDDIGQEDDEDDLRQCTIYICREKNNGQKVCQKRKRDLDRCEDSDSIPVGTIVAAILAFLALATAIVCIILLLIVLIALLVLMSKSGAEAAAIIGGFGANIEAMENPTFIEATTFSSNPLAG